jgi:quercetin dioxygenase-like cupin family protein
MKRFRTGPETAWPIIDYGSSFRLTRLLRSESKEARVDIAYLAPGDQIAQHHAGLPQLFCVLEGSGWVSGDDEIEYPIAAGEAAFWFHGELHSTRTETGLTALIIQSEELDSEALLTGA